MAVLAAAGKTTTAVNAASPSPIPSLIFPACGSPLQVRLGDTTVNGSRFGRQYDQAGNGSTARKYCEIS